MGFMWRVAGRRKSHTLPHNISTYQEDRERFVAPEFNTLKMTRFVRMNGQNS
jgi:hypothetical protein